MERPITAQEAISAIRQALSMAELAEGSAELIGVLSLVLRNFRLTVIGGVEDFLIEDGCREELSAWVLNLDDIIAFLRMAESELQQKSATFGYFRPEQITLQ